MEYTLGTIIIFIVQAIGEGEVSKADPAFTATPPGYGPRHMAIDAESMRAYVVFELDAHVGIYSIDANSGALDHIGMVALMPQPSDQDKPAEIEIFGNHLYVSNRYVDYYFDYNHSFVVKLDFSHNSICINVYFSDQVLNFGFVAFELTIWEFLAKTSYVPIVKCFTHFVIMETFLNVL
mgnify:CR=1 FL=1